MNPQGTSAKAGTVLAVALIGLTFQAEGAAPTPDLVWRHSAMGSSDTGKSALWIMDNETETATSLLYPNTVSDLDWQIVGTGDFNGDGKTDLVWQHNSTEQIAVWFMDGQIMKNHSVFNPDYASEAGWRIAGVADFNADGKPDLLWQHTAGDDPTWMIAIWYMNGTNFVTSTLTDPAPDSEWRVAATADFNADGKPDLLFQHPNGTIALWYMDGASITSSTLTYPTSAGDDPPAWRIVDAADFNQDGKPDFLWQHTGPSNPTGQVAYWYMDGPDIISSTVTDPDYPNPSTWRVAAAGDFTLVTDSDTDGLPDSWETTYFGNLNQAGSGDPDGDGATNAQEYSYGTNPTQLFTLVAKYTGLELSEFGGASTPDAHGAVGPDHFVQILNARIAAYDKGTGQRIAQTDLNSFFAVTVGGTNYPTAGAYDPRLMYDHQSQRWIACAGDSGSQNILLAVSKTSDPVGSGSESWVSDKWTKYLVPASTSGYYSDYPTLGVDSNGIYIGVHYGVSGVGVISNAVFAIWKSPLLGTGASSTQGVKLTDMPQTGNAIQPAVNYDSVSSDAVAWFVTEGFQSGVPYVRYGRLTWNTSENPPEPSFLESNWNTNSVPVYGSIQSVPWDAPQAADSDETTQDIDLAQQGTRLMMAVVRNGYLWTCNHIGVSANGLYDIQQYGVPDRTACQWLKFQIQTGNNPATLAYSDFGRVYDSTASETSPDGHWWYFMPSLMVNSRGDVVLGCSRSRSDEHIGAAYAARLGSETSWSTSGHQMNTPKEIEGGKDFFENAIWGDYTYTSLDPNDSLTIWTVQQYAETRTAIFPNSVFNWGTVIGAISAY